MRSFIAIAVFFLFSVATFGQIRVVAPAVEGIPDAEVEAFGKIMDDNGNFFVIRIKPGGAREVLIGKNSQLRTYDVREVTISRSTFQEVRLYFISGNKEIDSFEIRSLGDHSKVSKEKPGVSWRSKERLLQIYKYPRFWEEGK